jgi:glucokinase
MNNIVTGIDIGGSHITVALINLGMHSIISESKVRHPVNAKGSAVEIIDAWANAIRECKKFCADASSKIGIAMPGPFDYEKGICQVKGLDKFESLYGLNVKRLLSEQLAIEPTDIFMMNDASCFLKGEVFGGAAQDCQRVIGITLGTGLGSGVYKDGTLHDGDLYYTPFRDANAEDYLSVRWFIKEYFVQTGVMTTNVKAIAERVSSDTKAANTFHLFGSNLGEVLSTYIKKHQAETVVIGGNIMKAWDLFVPETLKVLDANSIQVSVVKAMLGEEAALLGAGSLCLE